MAEIAVKSAKRMIRSNFKVRSKKFLISVYQTYFAPIALYASECWYNSDESCLIKKKLDSLFRKFWQLSNGKFELPDVLSLNQLAVRKNLMLLHKMRRGESYLKYHDYFKHSNNHTTRSWIKNDLVFLKYRLKSRRLTFPFVTCEWYNKLGAGRNTMNRGKFLKCVNEMNLKLRINIFFLN